MTCLGVAFSYLLFESLRVSWICGFLFFNEFGKDWLLFLRIFFFYPILSPLLGDSDHKYIGWTDIVAQIINTFFFSVSLSFILDNVCWHVFKFTVLQYSLCCEMSSLFQILDFYFRYRSRLSVAFVITISLLRFLIQPFIFNHWFSCKSLRTIVILKSLQDSSNIWIICGLFSADFQNTIVSSPFIFASSYVT